MMVDCFQWIGHSTSCVIADKIYTYRVWPLSSPIDMYRFHLDGKTACKFDNKRAFKTICLRYSLRHGRHVRCPQLKKMDILKLISNEGKLVLVFCHFAQVKLDHLVNLLFNLDLKNCNPIPVNSIFDALNVMRL